MRQLPRDDRDDYTHVAAAARRRVVSAETGASLHHVAAFSFDPGVLPGNMEGFSGVAQVPLGFAGPLLIHGEHASGEYFVPLATTEGTLVASYGRGMRLTRAAGGVTATVIDDAMQRAPVFVFEDARAARDFGQWVEQSFAIIKTKADESSRFGSLRDIEQYALGPMRWLRFNFTTGDAAGQNMVTKSVHEVCKWMINQQPRGLTDFALAANLDTDKKHSSLNNLHTRGKRVVAEATLPASLLEEVMHTSPKDLYRLRQLSNMGTLLAGSISNGAQYANGIAAIFVACGQDVANVAESSAGFSFSEVRPDGSYYVSVTIPSLVVATIGGGTGLPTQRECLEVLGCYGQERVHAFAEIVVATVLCGELSLASAIMAGEWVSSHEVYGRNRPTSE